MIGAKNGDSMQRMMNSNNSSPSQEVYGGNHIEKKMRGSHYLCKIHDLFFLSSISHENGLDMPIYDMITSNKI